MRLLLISHEYPPIGGGGANACENLAEQYALRGHHVQIVTVGYGDKIGRETIAFGSGSVTIDRLKARRKRVENCGFTEMLDFLRLAVPFSRRLVKESKETPEPFDVCQVFFGIPSGVVGWWLKKRERLPYIIRFGGGDIPGFQERFQVLYKVLSPVLRMIWKEADALVANSEGLRQRALAFCDRYPVCVIPNGVDMEQFTPAVEKRPTDREVTLLFVSRLIERKGLQYVIPKMKAMESVSGKRLHLLIVGDGPYRDELERLTAASELGDRVIFAGQRQKSELPALYRQGDVFILPSKREGMPNVVLEAMACGLPVVMSPCEGSKELIQGNGIIADSDLNRFDEAIMKALALSPQEREAMGEAGRKRAEACFSWKAIADEYLLKLASVANTDVIHARKNRRSE